MTVVIFISVIRQYQLPFKNGLLFRRWFQEVNKIQINISYGFLSKILVAVNID